MKGGINRLFPSATHTTVSASVGALAQLGERFAGSEEVRGSIPLGSTKTPSVLLKTKRYIANISIDFASDIDDSQRNLARPFAITYSTTRPKQLFVSCCNFYLKAAEHVFNNNFMGNAYWQHIGVSK